MLHAWFPPSRFRRRRDPCVAGLRKGLKMAKDDGAFEGMTEEEIEQQLQRDEDTSYNRDKDDGD